MRQKICVIRYQGIGKELQQARLPSGFSVLVYCTNKPLDCQAQKTRLYHIPVPRARISNPIVGKSCSRRYEARLPQGVSTPQSLSRSNGRGVSVLNISVLPPAHTRSQSYGVASESVLAPET